MAMVVESDHFAVILVDSGSGNYWTSEITANVVYDRLRVAFVWLCINIETMLVFNIAFYFTFLKEVPS